MGLLLKDRDGNVVDRGWADSLNIPYQDSDGNISERTFTQMYGLYCYAYQPLGDGSIRILKKITRLAGNDVWFFGVNEDELKEYGYQLSDGTYGVGYVILRNGNLVEGNTYTTEEILQ